MREGTYIEKLRLWHQPKTEVTVTRESIGSRMKMEDFRKALKYEFDLQPIADKLKAEIGSIALTFSQDTFGKKVDQAMKKTEDVIEEQLEIAIEKVIAQI